MKEISNQSWTLKVKSNNKENSFQSDFSFIIKGLQMSENERERVSYRMHDVIVFFACKYVSWSYQTKLFFFAQYYPVVFGVLLYLSVLLNYHNIRRLFLSQFFSFLNIAGEKRKTQRNCCWYLFFHCTNYAEEGRYQLTRTNSTVG